ncbi:MAG: DUF362 domain-containing protein [Verrucomicrobia bacterium]|nr:DUF362 domain-containing protein [Verrucomicrobiota bacterium]
MKQGPRGFDRRGFLKLGAGALVGAALRPARAAEVALPGPRTAKVSIVPCRDYAPANVRAVFDQSFDQLGGIGPLVKDKTVTVKINLTGSKFAPILGRPVGESFLTHPTTVMAMTAAFFAVGARRVRLVESTQLRETLDRSLAAAGFDVNALNALGRVEVENTRNLGFGKSYANFKVPSGGNLFSEFELNHSYADTDVFVSLCKLKTHATTGITLTMKNLFGITPNALYGDDAPDENCTKGRGRIHDPEKPWDTRTVQAPFDPPGTKREFFERRDSGYRIPRVIADVCEARPIHLGIIDGITTLNYAEGPWVKGKEQKIATPRVLICGFNPVATDTVGTAVMGFSNVRGTRGTPPFGPGDNHLVLAERVGLGPCDLSRIDVTGPSIEKVRSREILST